MSQNPFGPEGQNPFASQTNNPYNAPAQAARTPETEFVYKEIKAQSTTALIVGIISLVFCGIVLAPFAIYRGSKAQRLIEQYNIGHECLGNAKAGKIIGIISLVLNILVLGFYFFVMITAAAAGR